MPQSNPLPEIDKIIAVDPLKILININASNYLLARRYPVDCFTEIVYSLNEWNSSLEFYLTGSREEIEYVSILEKNYMDFLSGMSPANGIFMNYGMNYLPAHYL